MQLPYYLRKYIDSRVELTIIFALLIEFYKTEYNLGSRKKKFNFISFSMYTMLMQKDEN